MLSNHRLDKIKSRTVTVMQQVLYTLEPLPIDGLDVMHRHFSHKDSKFNVVIVLHFWVHCQVVSLIAPCLSIPSIPHFLISWLINLGVEITLLGSLTFRWTLLLHHFVLQEGLCFNICDLQSSYLLNSEVPDLTERVKAKILPHLSYSC